MLTTLDESDAGIINDTTLIITPQSDTACITIEPVDDQIAEGAEFFSLTAMADNTLDSVNGTTNIEILANDGMHVDTGIKIVQYFKSQTYRCCNQCCW